MLECLEFLIFLGDMICHLEQRRPETNRQRFYAVAVKQDLFGDWLLCRRWGRIGTRGRGLVEAFAAEVEAEETARRLIRAKTRRGYGVVGQGA
jgi:predicted DNA-binding WGR domain protein